ncbi:MAG TPA: hypothetical protein VMQ86_02905 [Bryobacteraceae bacterium]|jgi:hypothetical protein|nr:hypothetical protein [Bryobacteraceae bacterium]
MTDSQLYLAIGVPILFNALGFTLLILYIQSMRDLWRAELRRVEEVLDARLKHVEERLEHIENR